MKRYLLMSCAAFAAVAVATTASAESNSVTVAGHQLSVLGSGYTHTVTLDGHTLVSDGNDMTVSLLGPYTGAGHAYVLISEQSGGDACAAVFQGVDLSGPSVRLTPSFGSCDDEPRVRVTKSGQLVVITRRAMAPRYEVDIVQNGSLKSGTTNR